MLNIEKETADNGAVILKLIGDATVENADQLHQALLEGLRENKQLMVDCNKTTSIDFYAIQLLCSAHRSSVSWDKSLSFHGDPADQVKQAISSVGFERDYGCALCPENVTCMWVGHNSSSDQ
jgi:anti-anti-sigma regulatory factor